MALNKPPAFSVLENQLIWDAWFQKLYTEFQSLSTTVSGLSGGTTNSQEFTSTGAFTFNVPTGVTLVYVTGIGAGQGGKASATNHLAYGGGSGMSCWRVPVIVTSGGTLTGSVGTGGAAVGPGEVAANDGGDTTIGSYIVLKGGGKGTSATGTGTSATGVGGGYGIAGIGGAPGGPGTTYGPFLGGSGGGSPAAGGRGGPAGNFQGGAVSGTTAGGGAASPWAAGGAATGAGTAGSGSRGSGGGGADTGTSGAGGNGYVLIEWIA